MDSILLAFLLACLGILIGAVINVLADDLPHDRWPRTPRYPNGAQRPFVAWTGLSAFVLGYREGEPIRMSAEEEKNLSLEQIANLEFDTKLSWRHPLTELSMALLLAFLALYEFEFPRIEIWAVFLSILMLITVIDLEHRLILFVVVVPSAVVVLVLNYLSPETIPNGNTRPFSEYLYGGLLGGGLFFLMYLGGGVFADSVAALQGKRISEVAFGFGDVMLAILCGFMVGWRVFIFATFITVFAGAAGAILYMTWRLVAQKRYTLYTALPYGPYIAFGTAVTMLFIDQLRDYIR